MGGKGKKPEDPGMAIRSVGSPTCLPGLLAPAQGLS